jgi:hypothetical protein
MTPSCNITSQKNGIVKHSDVKVSETSQGYGCSYDCCGYCSTMVPNILPWLCDCTKRTASAVACDSYQKNSTAYSDQCVWTDYTVQMHPWSRPVSLKLSIFISFLITSCIPKLVYEHILTGRRNVAWLRNNGQTNTYLDRTSLNGLRTVPVIDYNCVKW